MKRFSAVLALTLAFLLLFAACAPQKSESTSEKENAAQEGSEETAFEYNFEDGTVLSGKHYVEMDVVDYGTVTIEIDADAAPITATNFLRLVDLGFYDGLTFHRIISGFMAQGGDGSQTDRAGEATTIVGEFAANGYDNPISHTRGTISMARTNVFNSASSQFFIMHQDYTGLDGGYAAFGHVIDGIEVIDAMCDAADPNAPNGMLNPEDQPVINYIKILGTKNPLE